MASVGICQLIRKISGIIKPCRLLWWVILKLLTNISLHEFHQHKDDSDKPELLVKLLKYWQVYTVLWYFMMLSDSKRLLPLTPFFLKWTWRRQQQCLAERGQTIVGLFRLTTATHQTSKYALDGIYVHIVRIKCTMQPAETAVLIKIGVECIFFCQMPMRRTSEKCASNASCVDVPLCNKRRSWYVGQPWGSLH